LLAPLLLPPQGARSSLSRRPSRRATPASGPGLGRRAGFALTQAGRGSWAGGGSFARRVTMMGMARRPTTLYLDDEILRAARAMAARSERDESRVVEDALRSYLGLTVVEEVWRRSDLSEEQALALADEEKHAARE
jgi:predicted transcriptional regulator